MKRLCFLIMTAIISLTGLYAQDFYEIDTVNTIQLYFTESNWDQILDNLYAQGEERLTGTAVINGVTYPNVGVRYKGNSSYSANRTKNPFNIKLDHVDSNQQIGPYGTLKLANGFSDPSFIREVLGYEIARKYMPASKANFCNVYVNDVLIGVYTSVQDTDDYFGDTWFNTGDLARIKGDNDSMNLWSIWGYIDNNESSYASYYELDSGTNLSSFISFLNILNNNNAQLESVFNVDQHLWMCAFDNLFVNLDAPINFGHNYYVFEDNDLRFNSVLWDLNMCFGGFTRLMTGANLNATTMQQLNPYLNFTHNSYPILNKVLNTDTRKRQYIAHMRTMIQENITNNWYATRGAELQTIVAPSVQADPNYFYTYTAFQSNLNNSVSGGGQGGPGQGSTIGITQLMNTRATWLLNQTAFQGTVPEISNITCNPAIAPVNSTVWINATVSNTTNTWLYYRETGSHVFTQVQMFDDGAHNDSNAGDGVFGVSIDTGTNSLEYYIYSENSAQGAFSPARAAFEFLTLPVSTTNNVIVINEIMAKNASFPDANSELDDWIELYNPNDFSVDIAGMYLTDSHYSDGIAEWTQIPSGYSSTTTIPAQGYLVVWFDENLDQGPLHINQKLGGGEDSVYLISSDGTTVIDSKSWVDTDGLNVNDVSYGRLPDGGTNWTLFGAGQTYPCTQGTSNQSFDNSAPLISDVQYTPQNTTETSTITISAQVTDTDNNLSSVQLQYGTDEVTDNTLDMTLSGDVYTAQIGPFALNSVVKFRISATDAIESNTNSPIYSITIGFVAPVLYINEVMVSNTITITDEAGEYEDWVEIYNPNDYEIDLAGYYLTDNHYPTASSLTQIPSGYTETIISAHGYKIIWFDEDLDQGPLHMDNKLGTSGDAVYLIAPDMLNVIDQVTWTADTGLAADLSYGRNSDGASSWMVFGNSASTPVTPGTANSSNSSSDLTVKPMTCNIYPNPIQDKMTLEVKGAESGYKVQIYNIKGQLINEFSSDAGRSVSWDTRDKTGKMVSSGIYFVRTTSNNQSVNKKICVMK